MFLLSIRAGGVGLNLQAADTVIMYDTGEGAVLPGLSCTATGVLHCKRSRHVGQEAAAAMPAFAGASCLAKT